MTNTLQWRAGQLPGQTQRDTQEHLRRTSTFNGGPGNCPAKRIRADGRQSLRDPSMEGRAIARPNYEALAAAGGLPMVLQWRAGQLPGQTSWPRASTP